MKVSDMIADFIAEMLTDGGGVAQLQRRTIADRFSCVPSQINYVIETRFTPENGYLVESRRGGGGYIRIIRIMDDGQRTLLAAAEGVGDALSQDEAARLTRALAYAGLLEPRECRILQAACADRALTDVNPADRDRVRACVYRAALTAAADA